MFSPPDTNVALCVSYTPMKNIKNVISWVWQIVGTLWKMGKLWRSREAFPELVSFVVCLSGFDVRSQHWLLSKTGVSVSSFFRCFQNKVSHLVGNSIRGNITKVEVTKLKGSFWTPRSWCLVPSSLPGWDVSWVWIFLSSSRRFRITCLLFWPVTLSPVRSQVPRSQV